jgi:cyclic beta-1,2-glucan synthetase
MHDRILQRRFHANPIIKSGEILLEEKIPSRAIITKDYKEEVHPFTAGKKETVDFARTFELTQDRELPVCHLLSNGRYSLLITDRGGGFSQREGIQLTRWRRDFLTGHYGLQIFLKSLEDNKVWTTGLESLNGDDDSCQVTFLLDRAVFTRRNDLITTHTEVTVAPEDDVEIRRVVIANNGPEEVILELTSYGELVLGDRQGDLAHPTFSSLFIKTESLPEEEILLASRRPRSQHQAGHWAFHSLLVEGETLGQLQFETNRGNFLGRNRTPANPQALEKPLSGMTGTVLDPIFSLRRRVRVKPDKKVALTFMMGYGENREQALSLARKYRNSEMVNRAFEMADTRSQVEAQFLNLTAEQIALYQDLLPHILFAGPLKQKQAERITANKKGQPGLWAYGISGDNPILLVTVETREGLGTVKEVMKAHEYWRTKGLLVDLVILNEDKSQYFQPLQDLLRETVAAGYARHLMDSPGGLFLRHGQSMPEEDRNLLYTVAGLVIDANAPIRTQLTWSKRRLPSQKAFLKDPVQDPGREETLDLQLWNGYGGFNQDGKEYVIRLRDGNNTPAPWINVIANRQFGFQVSETGAGFAWAENSRENKLTQWSNDPVTDPTGEVVYLRDEDTGAVWSITPQPVRELSSYTIHHGLGYSRFHHDSQGLEQEQIVFVPVEDPVKITLVRLVNHSKEERNLSLFYYLRPVMGVHEEVSAPYLVTDFHEEEEIIKIQNVYQADFPHRVAFVAASEKIVSYTGDRREFLGSKGQMSLPEALERERLSNQVGAGFDPCVAIQVQVTIPPGQHKELVFLLGQAQEQEQAVKLARQYGNPEIAARVLEEVKSRWESTLEVIQVRTPDITMDLMLNYWLMYQNIACRLWARSAFYQSGGAYGYRDQLQDSLNAIYIDPEITKRQLLLHAAHQFKEGDVLHWWHPGAGDRGVRTRFTDDRLWLPFVLVEYLERTGDYSILTTEAPYLEGVELAQGEDEKYFTPTLSRETGTLYEHCLRAIEISLQFGEHGLPLMGSGDWNDGMSTVGNQGRGESVWLGWFLYYILKRFVPICRKMEDYKQADRYEEMIRRLSNALEEAGWDGAWYRRAYFDDGTPLGSAMNSECSIDSLAQSWAVIAGNEREERRETAMDAVEQNLVDRDLGLIKLFTPPFENGDLEPGYIKGYVAGVRENGAQYTHAAAWVIKAFAMLGKGDKAAELFHMVNPINHARTPIECAVYKTEPYVVAADVYTVSPQEGRGGWTWYTGAAGWLYRVGLEDILGFRIKSGRLYIDPCIPKDWPGFVINYRYGKTMYHIKVENPQGVNRGIGEVWLDGQLTENGIPLSDDEKTHQVKVVMAPSGTPVLAAGKSGYETE